MRHEKSLLENYIESTFTTETAAMKLSKEKASNFGNAGMSIGPSEGALLAFLVQLHKGLKIVEFGTFTGYSALWLLQGTNNKGKVWTFEFNEEHARLAQEVFKFAQLENQIQIHIGSALEKVSAIEAEGPFDVVFIDANKNAYLDYLEWSKKHLKSGGLIIADNTLLGGMVFNPEQKGPFSKGHLPIMKKFNEYLGSSSEFQSIMIPTYEGLTVAIKK